MLSVLSIGNSFSQDAQRYLHQTAAADGVELTCVNLYIGGCPLWRHFRNYELDEKAYELQYNGECTGFNVSIREALLNREWDYVTLQQASHFSPKYETYEPYLTSLAAEIRRLCPQARFAIHETWAYAQDSERLTQMMGYTDEHDMFREIESAYTQAAADSHAELMIPAGRAMMALRDMGLTAHRDGFHASRGMGRYAIALTWYHALTGGSIADNALTSFDVPVSPEEIRSAKKAAETAFA